MSQKVVDAAMALIEIARESAAADALVSEDGERLMAMSRRLCEADGQDPDVVVMGVAGQSPTVGAKGLATIYAPIVPAWCVYWDEAVKALKLVRSTEPTKETEDEGEVRA